MQSPEVQHRIAILRQKATDNSLTMDEMKEAIQLIRGDRRNAQAASDGARRKKATAAIPNADDLLSEMDGL